MKVLRNERQEQIARFISQRQRATVAELSSFFGVSEPTIRRDLDRLDETGRILRAHGGAMAKEPAMPEPPIVQRIVEWPEEKRRIGAAAAQLINDGETVFLGSGTTTLEVARHLRGKKNLAVITNALTIANVLAGVETLTVIITGGILRHSEASMIGYIVEQTLKELRADKVIMSMRAISVEHGLTNEHLSETMIDRAIIRFAPEVILVADHTKFGKASTVRVAPVTAVHRIVTDSQAPAEIVQDLRRLGIDVIEV